MYDVEQAFQQLEQILDQNSTQPHKDFWSIYFYWWRFFYCLNENIEATPHLADKVTLIEQFLQYNKELTKRETALLERYHLQKHTLPPVEAIPFASHIQNMQTLLHKEQTRLGKLMKAIKQHRSPPKRKPSATLRKRGPSSRKWLRT